MAAERRNTQLVSVFGEKAVTFELVTSNGNYLPEDLPSAILVDDISYTIDEWLTSTLKGVDNGQYVLQLLATVV